MGRKTKEEALETRNNILAAAIDLFWEKGVAGTSLEMIAERAGVTRGAIYWHFKNKHDMFEALHEQLHRSFLDIIMRDMETDHPRPLHQLEQLCTNLLLNLASDTQKSKVLSIFFLRCDYSGDMACFLERQNQRKTENAKLLQRYFERAIAKGHLAADIDPSILTLSLHCYSTGIMHEYLRNPDAFDMQHHAPALMAQFFRGLKQSGSAQQSI